MRRKIIQIANSTQLISLPRKWALSHNLKKGDELEVEPHGNKIVVSTDQSIVANEIELDISGLDRTSIMYYLRSAYRCGYNTLKIKFSKPVCLHYRTGKKMNVVSIIHKEVNRLVGMEFIQQKENYCVVKSLSEPTQGEFDMIVRRIFRLTADAYEDLVKIAREGDMVLAETIEEKHDAITKFVSYCLRLLNKKGHPNFAEAFFLYHIIANMDNIVDIIKYAGRDLLRYNKKMSKDSVKILEDIRGSITSYYDFFYRYDPEKIKKLSENRDQVKFKVREVIKKKVPHDEILILSGMIQLLEMLLDLTEARASVWHCSKLEQA